MVVSQVIWPRCTITPASAAVIAFTFEPRCHRSAWLTWAVPVAMHRPATLLDRVWVPLATLTAGEELPPMLAPGAPTITIPPLGAQTSCTPIYRSTHLLPHSLTCPVVRLIIL